MLCCAYQKERSPGSSEFVIRSGCRKGSVKARTVRLEVWFKDSDGASRTSINATSYKCAKSVHLPKTRECCLEWCDERFEFSRRIYSGGP